MSKYLRCFLLLCACLMGLEILIMLVFSAQYPNAPGIINIIDLPVTSFVIWLLLQFLIVFIFSILMSRTDSTTVGHTMIFAAMIGLIVTVVQNASLAIDTNHWSVYLTLMPVTIVKFTIAGWLFAKQQ